MRRACVVRLLGGFRVEVDGRPVAAAAWRHRRGADLVKLLALSPQHRLHREVVMESLWPDLPAPAAGANLRKAVHYARRALGRTDAIGVTGEVLILWPEGNLTVDAEHAEAAAAGAQSGGHNLEAAVELFTGELLPEDRYEQWTESARERLRARHLEVLRGTRRWGQILELDPSDEEACRSLMKIHLAAGNRQAAIRQFQRLREILRVDMGVAPEAATVSLFEEAVARHGSEPPSPVENVQALLAQGLLFWNRRDFVRAELMAAQARDLAMQHHLGRELGEASSLLGMVAHAAGQWSDRFREEFVQALPLAVEQAAFVMDAHLCLFESSLGEAEAEPIARLARDLLALAVEADSRPCEAMMSLVIGASELFSGRLDESAEWLSRADGLYDEIHWDSGRAFALVRLAEVALVRDRRDEALQHLAAARRLGESSELSSHLLVRIFAGMVAAADKPDARRRLLTEAEETLRPREVCAPCSIGFRVTAAVAYARSGDLERSRRELASADRIAGMWHGGPWQAAVWEARAALRLAEGDRGQAAALLREAATLFAESGRPLDEARCIASAGSPASWV